MCCFFLQIGYLAPNQWMMTQREGEQKPRRSSSRSAFPASWWRKTSSEWRRKKKVCCPVSTRGTQAAAVRPPLLWEAPLLLRTPEKKGYPLIVWPSPAPWTLMPPPFEFSPQQLLLHLISQCSDQWCPRCSDAESDALLFYSGVLVSAR